MEKQMILMNKDHPVLELVYDNDIHAVIRLAESHELKYASPAILDHRGVPNKARTRS